MRFDVTELNKFIINICTDRKVYNLNASLLGALYRNILEARTCKLLFQKVEALVFRQDPVT